MDLDKICPTLEQQAVKQALLSGLDVRVLAHAGSGKTATIMWALRELFKVRKPRVLIIEYNRRLKEDVQATVTKYDLTEHVVASNYDSVLTGYYDSTAPMRDFELSMAEVLTRDTKPQSRLDFDVLVVDEAQDITPMYMAFLTKLLEDNKEYAQKQNVQIVSIGDPKQSIYMYRGASARFMFEGLHQRPVKQMYLTHTFRFGAHVTNLVNLICEPLFASDVSCWFGPHRSSSADAPVQRFVLPADEQEPWALMERCKQLRKTLGKPLTFLTGSKRNSNWPMWAFLEHLGAANDYLLVETCEKEEEEGVLAKLSNAHACKGTTFEVVVLFMTNARSWVDEARGVMREILYVALTRSTAALVIVECASKPMFQNVADLCKVSAARLPPPYCAVTGHELSYPLERKAPPARPPRAPGDLQEAIMSKLTHVHKKQALDLIEGDEVEVWSDDESEALDALERVAVWARHHAERGERGDLTDLLCRLHSGADIAAAEAAAEAAYKEAWEPKHKPTARVRRLLVEACASDGGCWGRWLALAQLHPTFHYGHLAVQPRLGAEGRCQRALELLRARCAGLSQVDGTAMHYACLRFGHECYVRRRGDAQAEDRPVLLVLDFAQAERASDRIFGACLSTIVGAQVFEVCYVTQSRLKECRLLADRRAALKAVFRAAMAPSR